MRIGRRKRIVPDVGDLRPDKPSEERTQYRYKVWPTEDGYWGYEIHQCRVGSRYWQQATGSTNNCRSEGAAREVCRYLIAVAQRIDEAVIARDTATWERTS